MSIDAVTIISCEMYVESTKSRKVGLNMEKTGYSRKFSFLIALTSISDSQLVVFLPFFIFFCELCYGPCSHYTSRYLSSLHISEHL